MSRKVYVIGVGMTKFEKPGAREGWDYPDMAKEAILKALADANISYKEIQYAAAGYCYGDSTCGQRAVYGVGLTGIPVINVNNNCSTGSTALFTLKQLVEGGIVDCGLAFGFEKMERGSLKNHWNDRTNPLDQHVATMANLRGFGKSAVPPQMFGNAGKEHMEKYGTTKEQLAKIAWKNHKHSVNNPYSQFRDEYSLEDILKSPVVHDPLTKLQCCPTSDGAAAVILASEQFVRKHGLEHQAVEIIAMEMRTDFESSFQDSCIKNVGYDMSKAAAQAVYKKTGLTPNDVQVIELHDCFSANELLTYEALGLCKEGEAGKLVDRGETTYGGKWVVNPSGGLISKGHPLGATGLAQCSELCWQLRAMAGPRQVKNAKLALQHNIGLGGAVVVAMYRLGFPDKFKPHPSGKPNPAIDPTVLPQAKL
jgi:sterol carrier protein 2